VPSFWLDDRYRTPPRSKSEDVASFLGFWDNFTSMRKAIEAANMGRRIDFEGKFRIESDTFVFTHHDLAHRNILLAPSGEL
jgi:predicted xylose isomerase-like sugar epimerase